MLARNYQSLEHIFDAPHVYELAKSGEKEQKMYVDVNENCWNKI